MLLQAVTGVANYYVTISELTPLSDKSGAQVALIESGFKLGYEQLTAAVMVFFIVLLFSLSVLVYSRFKDTRRVFWAVILALTVGMLPLAIQLVRKQTGIITEAKPTLIPRQVQITDVTDTGFSVCWQTDEAAMGAIRWSSRDDDKSWRTVPETQGEEQRNHRVVVNGLAGGTVYYLEIFSFNQWYNQQGVPIVVMTKFETDEGKR